MIMYSVSINILWPWLTQNMMRKREERDAYPHLAVREGILNAIVHRDYTDNNQINLNIYAESPQWIAANNSISLVFNNLLYSRKRQ